MDCLKCARVRVTDDELSSTFALEFSAEERGIRHLRRFALFDEIELRFCALYVAVIGCGLVSSTASGRANLNGEISRNKIIAHLPRNSQ